MTYKVLETLTTCCVPQLHGLISRTCRDIESHRLRTLTLSRSTRSVTVPVRKGTQAQWRGGTHGQTSEFPNGRVRSDGGKHRNLDNVFMPSQLHLGLPTLSIPYPRSLVTDTRYPIPIDINKKSSD